MAKSKTEIQVTAVFDGELDATDVFVSLIAQKYSQRKDNISLAKTQDLGYNKTRFSRTVFRLDCAGNGYDERIYRLWTRFLRAASGRPSIAGFPRTTTWTGRAPVSPTSGPMLENYCEKQGWEVVAVYQDDGYTGLNMERPDLKRMLKAIERKQVNLVITKDLSGWAGTTCRPAR